MNELELLEEFLELINGIQQRSKVFPRLFDYEGQEYPEEYKVLIRSLVDEVHDLLVEIPAPEENIENPPRLLFQHRHKMLNRTYTFYELTIVLLKLFLETNNFETQMAWHNSSKEQFNSHRALENQIEKEIRRWKKRTVAD
jgi:hypothetical protein